MTLHGAFFYLPSPRQVGASLPLLYSSEAALAWNQAKGVIPVIPRL